MADEKKLRVVLFVGDVTHERVERVTREVFDLWREDSETEITMYLASNGGNTTAGLAFYEFVKTAKVPLRIIALGDIASMGFILWLAGTKRQVSPHTSFLLHEIGVRWENVRFRTSGLEREAREMRFDQDIFDGIIAEATGRTRQEVAALAREERKLSLAEAIDFGLLKEEDIIR